MKYIILAAAIAMGSIDAEAQGGAVTGAGHTGSSRPSANAKASKPKVAKFNGPKNHTPGSPVGTGGAGGGNMSGSSGSSAIRTSWKEHKAKEKAKQDAQKPKKKSTTTTNSKKRTGGSKG